MLKTKKKLKYYQNTLPNSLIIGVQKSATTWLSKRLSQHPDIYIFPGEVHYFDNEKNFSKGPEWYSSIFRNSLDKVIRCEKSPDYFWTTCDDVPNEPKDKPLRIKQLIPEAKLILILRNPVTRAISGWNHNVRSGAILPSLDINKIFLPEYSDVVKRHGILSRGLYFKQLSEFLNFFHREQILVLFFESDIIKTPELTLEKTVRFLGANNDFKFKYVHDPENKLASTKLGVWASYYSTGILTKVVHKFDRNILKDFPLPKWKPANPNRETLEKLKEYYNEENIKLSKLIGSLPDDWNY